MDNGRTLKGIFTFVGLAAICWGLWEYDPRIAMISGGLALFLMGIGRI